MRGCPGFTLVEVLVALLIVGILSAAIFMVLNIGVLSFDVDAGMLELQQQLRQAMNFMVRELRQAQNLTVTAQSQSADKLSFSTASETGISYYLDAANKQLLREYPAGTTKVLGNDINYFKCSFVSPLLEIRLQADKTVRQKSLQFSLAEKVRLRNEQ